MIQIQPRRVAHQGSVLASGLAIDTRLVPDDVARERILGMTIAGCDIFHAGLFFIVRFRTPLRMNCGSALGTPLVRHGRLLSASPLEPDEQAALETVSVAVGAVLVSGGSAAVIPLDEAVRADISLWVDISEFTVVPSLRPLGEIPLEPRAQLLATPVDLRRSMGVPPLDVKMSKLLQVLRDRNSASAAKSSEPPRRSWFVRLRAAVAKLALRRPGRSQPAAAASGAVALPSEAVAQPRGPGLRSRFQQYLARMLWSSGLGHVLGRQYRRYLSRLLDMFDGNDLDNALRHAFSLNAELGPGMGRLPFWTPAPREDLSIKTGPREPAKGLGLGDELYNMLRERYRRAFQRLETLGEIEKAAFVLAELLNASEEAVAFLERHELFKLAAEIAESRNLAPGLAIRLWFLAGDRQRAIRIARRTGAFADAVIRLDASHKKEAAALRLLWADKLAEAGQYAAAADVAWPVEEARSLVFSWMDRAIETGGATGARMLARKLRTRPETFAELRETILPFLQDDDDATEIGVKAFGQELIAVPPSTDEVRLIARETARRLLRGIGDKEAHLFVQKLAEASGDEIFRADVRGVSLRSAKGNAGNAIPLAQRSEPLRISRFDAGRGGIALSDAAALPDGKMLVAAGELGALLLSRDGTMIARFSAPASHIVMSDNGDRAILVAKRGETFHLTRVDLLTKTLRPWCQARFDQFAPDFDGFTWFVARGGTLYAIDALAERWEHYWKIDEPLATISSVQRIAVSLSAFFKWEGRYPEMWTYDYPSLILRRRRQINQGDALFTDECISACGNFAGWRLYNKAYAAYLNSESGWITLPQSGSGNARAHCLTNQWIVQSASSKTATVIYLLDCDQRKVRAQIEFEGTTLNIAARIRDAKLIACDNEGRFLIVDLGTGAVIREHPVP